MTRLWMSEDKVERIVQYEMDKLDRKFMNGKLSREQYDREVAVLDKWAAKQTRWINNEPEDFIPSY